MQIQDWKKKCVGRRQKINRYWFYLLIGQVTVCFTETPQQILKLKGETQLSVMSRFKNQEKKMAKSCKSSIFTAISIAR